MVVIKQQLVPRDKLPVMDKYGTIDFAMTPKWITIHETGNTNVKAHAQAHANLQSKGNSRKASWHLQIDEKEAIQSLPFNRNGWHSGDSGGAGNRQSIGIELCVNSDGNFTKTKELAQKVVAQLMKQFGIPISNVVQHNKWSGKDCPTNLRKSGWNEFISGIKLEYGSLFVTASIPKPTPTPAPSTSTGEIGIIEVLVDKLFVRENASFTAKIVKENGKEKSLSKGGKFKAYSLKNGLYNVGGNQWVSAGKTYVKFTATAKPVPAPVPTAPKPIVPAPPSTSTKDSLYRVQVGAFKEKGNAEALKKELESKGFKPFISE